MINGDQAAKSYIKEGESFFGMLCMMSGVQGDKKYTTNEALIPTTTTVLFLQNLRVYHHIGLKTIKFL